MCSGGAQPATDLVASVNQTVSIILPIQDDDGKRFRRVERLVDEEWEDKSLNT